MLNQREPPRITSSFLLCDSAQNLLLWRRLNLSRWSVGWNGQCRGNGCGLNGWVARQLNPNLPTGTFRIFAVIGISGRTRLPGLVASADADVELPLSTCDSGCVYPYRGHPFIPTQVTTWCIPTADIPICDLPLILVAPGTITAPPLSKRQVATFRMVRSPISPSRHSGIRHPSGPFRRAKCLARAELL
jgi:hypothetical protein